MDTNVRLVTLSMLQNKKKTRQVSGKNVDLYLLSSNLEDMFICYHCVHDLENNTEKSKTISLLESIRACMYYPNVFYYMLDNYNEPGNDPRGTCILIDPIHYLPECPN